MRLARLCYIVASIAFVVIGAMHTITHFLLLITPQLQSDFIALGSIDILGEPATLWDLWQAMSLLMGVFSWALGAINLAIIYSAPKNALPPTAVCVVNILTLAIVWLVGLLYLGPIQIYGAPLGVLLFAVPILVRGRL